MTNALTSRDRNAWQQAANQLQIEGRAFIDGRYMAARSGRTFDDISPIDGRIVAQVTRGEAADVDLAVASCRSTFEKGVWRNTDPKQRKKVLQRFSELIRADVERLALLETLDVGKPIHNAINVDIQSASDCMAYYAEYADKLYDEVAPTAPNELALIRREPLGVVGAVVPWNYPLIISAWKLGPALLAGNSVVLKPAEQSPLGGIRLAELAVEAGLPPGVFNVVPGFGEEAGKALALHRDVDLIAFTGSTEVGKLMMRYSGESNLKRVALELGGKSPQVIMADADLAAAAYEIAWSIYYNSGETCHAGSRVLVQEPAREELLERIATVAKTITLGHPFEPTTQMGALIDAKHMGRVLGYIESGKSEGARVVFGGRQAMPESGGFYVEATVLDQVRQDMRVSREEIFGPVLAVSTFADESEALQRANDSIYGLAAAIWTSDMNVAHRMSNALRGGSVWVNTYDRSSLATPFGGFKQSGFGRDRSAHAIEKYSDFKTIWTKYT